MNTQETYIANVECANCEKEYQQSIPKGELIRNAKCDVCGCDTLHPIRERKK